MLLTLLLATPTLDVTPANVLSLVSICLVIWLAFRKESREDGQTVPQRLKKLETNHANHEERMTGFQQQHERTAERFTARCDDLEKQVAKVPALSESIVRMETRIEENAKTVEKIDRKMDKLLELLSKP